MPTGFTKNANRIDPYKTYKFRVLWDNKPILGISKVGPLRRVTNVVSHRAGGWNSSDSRSPGRTNYDAITMERGITHDKEFALWADRVHPYAGDGGMDLVNFKKELTLEVLNEKGQVAQRYFLHGAWVSEFTAIPQLDSNANAIAIETIKIEIDGWEPDQAAQEPDGNAPAVQSA